MSKIQIRNGLFETNSSSVHTIVIGNNGEDFYKELPENLNFRFDDFGWEIDVFTSTEKKASYLYTAIVYCGKQEYLDIIKSKLEKWGVQCMFEKNDEDYYYIDHGNELKAWLDSVCNKEEYLLNYLFSEGSFVATGNDNTDEEPFYSLPINVMLEYIKGN